MEPTKLSKLSSEIHGAIQAGRLERALKLVISNFESFLETGPLREKVAIILATEGRKKEAASILEAVARHYANTGHAARAVAAAHQIRKLNPDTTELFEHIATLYNIRSPFIEADARAVPFPDARGEVDFEPVTPELELDGLLEVAVDLASDLGGLEQQPQSLPSVPLLSVLPEVALRRALELVKFDIFDQTQRVLEKGKVADDLIWTVSDDLIVKDRDSTFFLAPGTLLGASSFGETGKEAEVDVFATAGCEILRLNAAALGKLVQEFGDFANRVATLKRHATCEALLHRHEIFEDLSDTERIRVMETFSGHRLSKGDVLIRQETPSPGLFIILDGKVDIVRNDGDWEITIATLGAGEVFGEIGLVAEKPAVAGCVMNSPGHVLHLPRADFEDLAAKYPTVGRFTQRLAEERLADVATTLSANDLSEIE